MKAFVRLLVVIIAAVGVAGWVLTRPAQLPTSWGSQITPDPEAGAQIFAAGGCASCHTAADAKQSDTPTLSGGKKFKTDFGTFYASNISSHPEHGIGNWTQAEFARALTLGVSPDGAHYYPAFPYASYTLMQPQDVVDLFAYLQQLPASDQPSRSHELGFPFSIRRGIGVWKAVYMPTGFTLGGELNETEQRGRYLAEALGHCAECHTPRTALGGLDRAAWMQGAPDPSGTGKIPGITRRHLDWSSADLEGYFSTGFTPDYDSAGGDMASVIQGLSQLPARDLEALAAYVLRLE